MDKEKAISGIEQYKDHPALLGYMTSDEPHYSPDIHQELKEMYQVVHEHDRYHPVWINHWYTGPDPKFTGVSDLVGYDVYPVSGGCFTQLERYWQQVYRLTHHCQPFVWVTQAYASTTSRLPSHLELRHMTYLMIIRGAKAVLFYTNKPWPFFVRYNGDLVGELKQISPILLSDYPQIIRPLTEQRRPGPEPNHTSVLPLVYEYPEDWPNIAAAAWRNGPSTYVIATNRQTYSVRATFQLPRLRASEVRVINEGRSLPFERSRWTDDFGPIAVHIYELVVRPDDSGLRL